MTTRPSDRAVRADEREQDEPGADERLEHHERHGAEREPARRVPGRLFAQNQGKKCEYGDERETRRDAVRELDGGLERAGEMRDVAVTGRPVLAAARRPIP